ncbi:hypothetical protein R4K92_06360 [Brachyspira intermedia]|uniref:hypothetical protein n=1 Tax=Brachyspira intermedia TaxID=84377 RepID=UPI003003EEF5
MLIDNERLVYCNDIINNDKMKDKLFELIDYSKNNGSENIDLAAIISNIEYTINYNFKINNISEEEIDFLYVLLKEYLNKYSEYNKNINLDSINKYVYNIPNISINDIKNNNELFPVAYLLSIFYFCNSDDSDKYFNDEYIKEINNIIFIENTDKISFKDVFPILNSEHKKRIRELLIELKKYDYYNEYIDALAKDINITEIEINNFDKSNLPAIKGLIEELFYNKKIREEKEKKNYMKRLFDIELNDVMNDNSSFLFMYLFSLLIYLFDDDYVFKKDIINIVIFENKDLIYFKDVFNMLDNNRRDYIAKLLYDAKNKEFDNDNIKRIISNIDIIKDKLIIKSLNEEDFSFLKDIARNIVLKEKDKKISEENNYIKEYLEEVFSHEIENENFPLIYLLIIFKYTISSKELYLFCNGINLKYEIMDLLFSDLNVCSIYIDESGNINENEKNVFVIGGYLIDNINIRKWSEITKNKFESLRYKFKVSDDTLLHRNELKTNKESVTYDIFNFLKINGGKFIYIYEKEPVNIDFTRQYYVDLISDLVISALNKKLLDENDEMNLGEKLLLIIKLSSRTYEDKYKSITFKYKDIENFLMSFLKNDVNTDLENMVNINDILYEWKKQNINYLSKTRYLEVLDIEPFIKDGIEKIKIKYGLNSENLEYSILPLSNAKKDTDLVIADYFCNMFYSAKYGNKIDSNILNSFSHMHYIKMEYNPFNSDIDLYLERKDYFNILTRYITYKKISYSNTISDIYKRYAQKIVSRILYYIEKDIHRNKVRYIIAALKSILENIEFESNSLKNYPDIIQSYDILIDLVNSNVLINNESLNKAIIFTINTEKLAVYNHSDNDKMACEVVEYNNDYKDDVLKSIDFKDRAVLFDTISSNVYWYKYNTEISIDVLYKMLSNNEIGEEERAKLYGTLGQSYNINYYVTDNNTDLMNAKLCYYKSMKYFNGNNFQIVRQYSYLQNLAISAKDEDKFLEYTEQYLNLISDDYKNIIYLNNKIKKYLYKSNKDKGYEFFVIRLLRYCNTFEMTEKSKEIAYLLISNKNRFENYITSLEDVDIQKEYALLLYKYNNGKIDIEYLDRCYHFMKDKSGIFNNMRMLSLYLIEILMEDYKHFDNALEKIEGLSNISDGYKNAFKDLYDRDLINDKKEWALKVRDKLYM